MTIVQFATSRTASKPAARARAKVAAEIKNLHLPSEAIMDVVRAALLQIGPFGADDTAVLSRVLRRLHEIEATKGQSVALAHAKELAELFTSQFPALR